MLCQVCNAVQASDCVSATISVAYPYNTRAPTFNRPFGQATLHNAKACNDDHTLEDACQVEFDEDFFATDADNDVLEYSIVPVYDDNIQFKIVDSSVLSISYVGAGITKDSHFSLMIQVSLVIITLFQLSKSSGKREEDADWCKNFCNFSEHQSYLWPYKPHNNKHHNKQLNRRRELWWWRWEGVSDPDNSFGLHPRYSSHSSDKFQPL